MPVSKYVYPSELRSRARSEGYAEGWAEGYAKGWARSVLRVLERRGLRVPRSVREQVMSCTDIAVLENWLDRAVVAISIDDVFA